MPACRENTRRQAVGRFNAELAGHRPDVVLLMEGTNDLYGEG